MTNQPNEFLLTRWAKLTVKVVKVNIWLCYTRNFHFHVQGQILQQPKPVCEPVDHFPFHFYHLVFGTRGCLRLSCVVLDKSHSIWGVSVKTHDWDIMSKYFTCLDHKNSANRKCWPRSQIWWYKSCVKWKVEPSKWIVFFCGFVVSSLCLSIL